MVYSAKELSDIIEIYGFLPFFKNGISGFSVEEMCPKELWFTDQDGPWEWKGPIAKSGRCLYGKFFGGKAGFISKQWIPDFVNYRRDGYDFDARYDDGLAPYKDKHVLDTVAEHGTILSTELKKLCHYRKDGNKGFDTVITRLQMQGYVCVADFVYKKDKRGEPYGWGVAQYTTPEHMFGYDYITAAYSADPSASAQKILNHLKELPFSADEKVLAGIVKR